MKKRVTPVGVEKESLAISKRLASLSSRGTVRFKPLTNYTTRWSVVVVLLRNPNSDLLTAVSFHPKSPQLHHHRLIRPVQTRMWKGIRVGEAALSMSWRTRPWSCWSTPHIGYLLALAGS
jgi:hypothetical protein